MTIRPATNLELRDLITQRDNRIARQQIEVEAVTARLHIVERERDAAQDVIENIRSIALRRSSTLWAKKILAALAQSMAGVES